MQTLQAIPTIYKNYAFRSRLEARYALFFDSLGVAYEYEPEGYSLHGLNYLPDFRLPEAQCWLEVKGQEPTDDEKEKARRLAIASAWPVFVVWGDPVNAFILSAGGILLFTHDRDRLPRPSGGAFINFLTLIGLDAVNSQKFTDAAIAARQRRFEEQ
jgi:hypothetical protein